MTCLWLRRLLLFVVAAFLLGPGLPSGASAQEPAINHRTIQRQYDRYEQRQYRYEKRRHHRAARKSSPARHRPVRSDPSDQTTAAIGEPAETEKLTEARKILVVGDFLADGLATGLETAFAESPGVVVVNHTNGSSGFVRDDFYDWPAEIGPILDEEKPAVVVVMIGSNDRQQMRIAGTKEDVRSEVWTKAYQVRVTRLAETIAQHKTPLIWVGMPPFRFSSMSADMLAFNDVYRNATEKVNGVFIDIWDGFADENGAFVTTGPDINGQPVRLRSDDGINFSKAGKRKLAFYVEKPLNKFLGDAASPNIASLENGASPAAGFIGPPAAPVINRTQPIALGSPDLDGSGELLGAVVRPKQESGATPARRLSVEGIAPDAPPGRADDFLQRPAPVAGKKPDAPAVDKPDETTEKAAVR